MSEKPMQLEIFDENQKSKKKEYSFDDSLQKPTRIKLPNLLCIKIACVIILVSISFALGVERGKIISRGNISTRSIAENKTNQTVQQVSIQKEMSINKETATQSSVAAKNIEKIKKDDKVLPSAYYIIQVVTYKKDSSYVEKEIAKLKKIGYSAILIPSDNFMVICAGKFQNKEDAQIHLRKLKQEYKDCFIRKI